MIRETADTTTHDTWWNNLHVALRHDPSLIDYPPRDRSPFDPDTDYPEYNGPVAESPNPVYGAVRATLAMLALDEPNRNTPDWNPLKGLVEPGMNVVIKPNLVADTLGPDADLSALFTSMSVIRPLIDYVQKALRGQGAITLGDAPIQRTDWDNLMALSGIAESIDRLNDRHDVPIRMVDFRREVTRRDAFGMVVHRELRDAVDYVEVDLARGSTLTPVTNGEGRFRVSQYDPTALQRHHNGTRNSYMIHRCVLDADVVIGVPKLKVHKKAGITCGLKNLVGIVCGKDWLPHYRIGDAQTRAGDQYEGKSRLRELYTVLCDAVEVGGRAKRRAAAVLRKGVSGLLKIQGGDRSCEGNWHGNDTTWRMVHDLNLILCYADANGVMTRKLQRRALYVVDGIIGGQRDAPLQPTARPAGVVIAGTNPLALDAVAATVIGLDPGKTPLLRDAWNAPAAWQLPPDGASVGDIEVSFDDEGRTQRLDVAALAKRINLAFEPPAGWVGAIERNPPSTGNGSSNPDAPASTSPAASEKKAVEHLVPPIGAFRP